MRTSVFDGNFMIKQIAYTNKQIGWHLDTLDLDPLTLLVGLSGVGKTRILYALNGLRTISIGKNLPGRKWKTTLQSESGELFTWSGEFENATLREPDDELFDEYEETGD